MKAFQKGEDSKGRGVFKTKISMKGIKSISWKSIRHKYALNVCVHRLKWEKASELIKAVKEMNIYVFVITKSQTL